MSRHKTAYDTIDRHVEQLRTRWKQRHPCFTTPDAEHTNFGPLLKLEWHAAGVHKCGDEHNFGTLTDDVRSTIYTHAALHVQLRYICTAPHLLRSSFISAGHVFAILPWRS